MCTKIRKQNCARSWIVVNFFISYILKLMPNKITDILVTSNFFFSLNPLAPSHHWVRPCVLKKSSIPRPSTCYRIRLSIQRLTAVVS